MDFLGPKPLEHKHQACFVAPQVKTNYSHGVTFKEKNSTITSTELFNNLNNQPNQLAIKNLVQKVNLMKADQQTQQQANDNYNQGNNGNNTNFEQVANNFAYDTSKVKIENDSNEGADRQVQATNYTNGLNLSDIRSIKMSNCYSLDEINQLSDQNNIQNSLQSGLGNLGLNFNYNLNSFNSMNINGLASLNSLQNLNTINNIKSIASTQQHTNGKRGSGRRPSSLKEDKLSPEEEERRKVRRERNKQAAARCRKRRVEHTNTLEKQTQGLEERKRNLNEQIQKLELEASQLMNLLKHHDCKIPVASSS